MRSILTCGHASLATAIAVASLMDSPNIASISARAGSDGLPDPNHVGGSGSIKHDGVKHDGNLAVMAIGSGGAASGGSGHDLKMMTDGGILGSAADDGSGDDEDGHSRRLSS